MYGTVCYVELDLDTWIFMAVSLVSRRNNKAAGYPFLLNHLNHGT